MIKNARSLMDKSRNLAVKNNIKTNEVLQNYMFERILERLSCSNYKNNFILKGGLLLSSMMGIDNRTTMDMDTSLKGIKLEDKSIRKILSEILSIDIKDGVVFELSSSAPIREEDDEYGGYRYKIVAKFDGIIVHLNIDIATGDLITPGAIEYSYKMLFEDRELQIMTYNIETIIAEKFQTLITRGTFNGRMRDYYDLYYLLTYKKGEISEENLKRAITKTFKKRETDLSSAKLIIQDIENSKFTENLWNKYTNKYKYANKLKFQDIIGKIKDIL